MQLIVPSFACTHSGEISLLMPDGLEAKKPKKLISFWPYESVQM